MDTYPSLQKLSKSAKPELEASFQQLAAILSKSSQSSPVKLQFSIVDRESEAPAPWSVAITRQGSKITREPTQKPDVEILTGAETWSEIAQGKLSPLRAFVTGRLRVRGDLGRAKQIFLRDLAAGRGEIPDWLE